MLLFFQHPEVLLKIPLGRAEKDLIARLFFSAHISGSFFLKKLLLHSTKCNCFLHLHFKIPTTFCKAYCFIRILKCFKNQHISTLFSFCG